jgi:hypothetical protein
MIFEFQYITYLGIDQTVLEKIEFIEKQGLQKKL